MNRLGKAKSAVALLAGMALLIGMLAACSGNTNSSGGSPSTPNKSETTGEGTVKEETGKGTEPLTFDIFVNFSWYGMSWTDPAAKKITESTGVTLNIAKPVSDDGQKMNIMLSNKDLPDLVLLDRNDTALKRMIDGGMLYSLDELIDEYAPQMRDVLPKEALTNYKAQDGKTYALVSFIEGEQYVEAAKKYNSLVGSNQPAWSIRQDYWEEIGKPSIDNAEEYMAALEQIHAKYPDKLGLYMNAINVANLKHLNDDGIGSLGTGKQFGVPAVYKDGDAVKSGLRLDGFKDVVSFLNQMVVKGLLTKDSYIDSKDIFTQKINRGDAISYVWSIGDGTKVPADNSNTSYTVMKPFPTYKQVRSGSGWTAIAITKQNKDPKRAIEFLAFLASEEGHKLTKWGVEGDTYQDAAQGAHYQVEDGKPTYLAEYWADKQKDWSGVAEQNGLSEYWLTANSTWWNMPEWDANDPKFIEYNQMFGDYVVYNPEFEGINLDPTTEIGIVEKKLIDLFTSYYSKMIFAKNEEQSLGFYNEFMEKAESLGLAEVEQAWTEAYQAKQALR
ncbi:hypothetical protein EBB07_15195 [Paenibacillaceae bacterium]|nr:hypothetical protein EBB07_15195 [Paenibacillaceae bacterium]